MSESLDDMKGKTLPVLDQGFVRLIDWMGDDAAVVQAARISYGAGTKKTSEDRGLIRYLMRHRHTTPFEMCELKLHVRVPMDAWRQWIRHRMASVNEYSTRYSEAIDAKQKTSPDKWRSQSKSNKQGSGQFIIEWEPDSTEVASHARTQEMTPGEWLSDQEAQLHAHADTVYRDRLKFGVAREQARKDLPLSTYTEAYWKIDLHNLLHFLLLRMDPHAQEEIRAYATVIGEQIVKVWCPLVWEAFEDYRLAGMTLSRLEVEALKSILRQSGVFADPTAAGAMLTGRELLEFGAKLTRLGLAHPFREGRSSDGRADR